MHTAARIVQTLSQLYAVKCLSQVVRSSAVPNLFRHLFGKSSWCELHNTQDIVWALLSLSWWKARSENTALTSSSLVFAFIICILFCVPRCLLTYEVELSTSSVSGPYVTVNTHHSTVTMFLLETGKMLSVSTSVFYQIRTPKSVFLFLLCYVSFSETERFSCQKCST